jgi:hypothetical protein
MSWEGYALAIFGLAALVLVCAGAGVVASVVYQTLSARGERARFAAELEPVQDEVEALRESFQRWRNKRAKQARDEKEEQPDLWDTARPPETAEERAMVKDRLRRMRQ